MATQRTSYAGAALELQKAMRLHQERRLKHAERAYEAVIAMQPTNFDAWHFLGLLRAEQGKSASAIDCLKKALKLGPAHPPVWYNIAVVLRGAERMGEALECCDKALALDRSYAAAHVLRGTVLKDLEQYEDALSAFDAALALKPDNCDAIIGRGNALVGLRRLEEAIENFDKALRINPSSALAHFNRGNTLRDLGRSAEALASYDAALQCDGRYADALHNRANLLISLHRPKDALASFDKLLALEPNDSTALGGAVQAALHCCDWQRVRALTTTVTRAVEQKRAVIEPFALLTLSISPRVQFENARSFIQARHPASPQPMWSRQRGTRDRLRLAYLSADFREHAVARLIAEVFELHDRARYEVFGISFGTNDNSAMRSRLEAAFDRFDDVADCSDEQIADLIRTHDIDIAIDLSGHTLGCRPGALAYRPAPVQINYLGYPGTSGAGYVDYIIADPVTVPFSQQKYYSERIVHLPDAYQANDRKRPIDPVVPSRSDVGLPEAGFVFCCFNNNYKITKEIFDIWMRLLGRHQDSVLWLLKDNDVTKSQLCSEAQARGVDPKRLVFAERVTLAEHLRRHRVASLFLDTLPYNAHTTASDALWAGLPLLTCAGETFPSRVAASLLKAAGLPELVTEDVGHYETLASTLVADPDVLRGYARRLQENRLSCALFDSARFTRHLEAAYERMWSLHQRGDRPKGFAVSDGLGAAATGSK